jgi:hypothetical protein
MVTKLSQGGRVGMAGNGAPGEPALADQPGLDYTVAV